MPLWVDKKGVRKKTRLFMGHVLFQGGGGAKISFLIWLLIDITHSQKNIYSPRTSNIVNDNTYSYIHITIRIFKKNTKYNISILRNTCRRSTLVEKMPKYGNYRKSFHPSSPPPTKIKGHIHIHIYYAEKRKLDILFHDLEVTESGVTPHPHSYIWDYFSIDVLPLNINKLNYIV